MQITIRSRHAGPEYEYEYEIWYQLVDSCEHHNFNQNRLVYTLILQH